MMRMALRVIKNNLSISVLVSAVIIMFSLLIWLWLSPLPAAINGQEKVQGQQKEGANTPISFDLSVFGPDGMSDLTEEQKSKLFSGEVIITSSPDIKPNYQTIVSAAILFPRSVEKVWAVLSAPERQAEYLEEIDKLKIIEQVADYNRIEFLVRIMGQKMRYTVIHHFEPGEYFFCWELDRSVHNDLKELYGFWKLYSVGDKTVGRYGSYIQLAFPVPDFIKNWLYKKNLRSSLKKVIDYVLAQTGGGENER
ncbi:MAG: hypothetical protein H5U07_11555 [Candidatus Aminicenantes bacterium]|nr:hypothetical protein [Candidatus Aminicenantes bacterium]